MSTVNKANSEAFSGSIDFMSVLFWRMRSVAFLCMSAHLVCYCLRSVRARAQYTAFSLTGEEDTCRDGRDGLIRTNACEARKR